MTQDPAVDHIDSQPSLAVRGICHTVVKTRLKIRYCDRAWR